MAGRATYGTALALVARLVPVWRCGRRGWVAGVALGGVDLHSALQAWHLATWTVTLRGRRGPWRHRRAFLRGRRATYGTGLALVARLVPVWRRGRRGCLRGRRGTWQAWHLAAWAVTLHGRRGTWHRRAFCVAGVPLWHWAGSGGALGSRLAVCVASVVLGDINLNSAWQAWHLATSTFTLRGAWHFATSTVTLRGRRGMLHYASMHLYVSLCISMYLYVSLCISMYLYVSLCISMCLYVSLCM